MLCFVVSENLRYNNIKNSNTLFDIKKFCLIITYRYSGRNVLKSGLFRRIKSN